MAGGRQAHGHALLPGGVHTSRASCKTEGGPLAPAGFHTRRGYLRFITPLQKIGDWLSELKKNNRIDPAVILPVSALKTNTSPR